MSHPRAQVCCHGKPENIPKMMFRSTRPENDESGSDWDDENSGISPITKAPASVPADRNQPSSSVAAHHVKKPQPAQSDTSGHVQPQGKPLPEVQFTNIERVESRRDRDTPLRRDRYTPPLVERLGQDGSTQTELRHAETETIHDGERLGPVQALTRSASGFSFITMGDEGASCRQLTLDHQTIESVMGGIAARSEVRYRRCAAEVFSTLRVATDCLVIFLLECLFFTAHHLCYKLLCGVATTMADACCKPGIPACFNSSLWPLCVLAWKVNKSVKFCLGPCMDLLGAMVTHCTMLARACRLVQVESHQHHKTEQV